jgi:hypothetical protein
VFFVWLKELFISRISAWFFFLRFSISLFTLLLYFVLSSLIHMSLFLLCSLFHFGVCLSPLKVHLFVSVSSHVLYFWCLKISWVHLIHAG